MVAGITLPEACAATCISSINVQRMSVHAAVSGDIDLLKLAVLHDPLVGAICTPEEVWQMVDEMVVAQAEWLPQYADAVPAAKERLEQGTVKTRDWEGVARRQGPLDRGVARRKRGEAQAGRRVGMLPTWEIGARMADPDRQRSGIEEEPV